MLSAAGRSRQCVDPIRIISGGQIRIANTSGLEKESGCMAHPQNWDNIESRCYQVPAEFSLWLCLN